MNIKALKCSCCGGNIDRRTLRCDFCGTEYVIENDVPTIKFETFRNPTKLIRAVTNVPRDLAVHQGDDFREHVIRQLARQLSEEMYDCMRLGCDFDPLSMSYRVCAEARVVVPKER